jgi:hypothetical protein
MNKTSVDRARSTCNGPCWERVYPGLSRSATTFWVIWYTYILTFPFIGCFINFQKLKNRAPFALVESRPVYPGLICHLLHIVLAYSGVWKTSLIRWKTLTYARGTLGKGVVLYTFQARWHTARHAGISKDFCAYENYLINFHTLLIRFSHIRNGVTGPLTDLKLLLVCRNLN